MVLLSGKRSDSTYEKNSLAEEYLRPYQTIYDGAFLQFYKNAKQLLRVHYICKKSSIIDV